MPCYHPIKGFQGAENENGKRPFSVSRPKGLGGVSAEPMEVPCGQCIGCRLERSRQWAVRIMHENDLHTESCFTTLTYDDDNLPKGGSLNVRDIQLFLKRLRRSHEDKNIRYFQCGEYGENFSRPHHHAIIFGYDFPDRVPINKNHGLLATSDELADLWPHGFVSVGDVTFNSAAYVASYVVKKVTGKGALIHYAKRMPEFITMSRRPGIGSGWFDRFHKSVYDRDSVIVRGKECKPPRYYDKKCEEIDPELFGHVHDERRKNSRNRSGIQNALLTNDFDPYKIRGSDEKLSIRESNVQARQELFNKRGFENG